MANLYSSAEANLPLLNGGVGGESCVLKSAYKQKHVDVWGIPGHFEDHPGFVGVETKNAEFREGRRIYGTKAYRYVNTGLREGLGYQEVMDEWWNDLEPDARHRWFLNFLDPFQNTGTDQWDIASQQSGWHQPRRTPSGLWMQFKGSDKSGLPTPMDIVKTLDEQTVVTDQPMLLTRVFGDEVLGQYPHHSTLKGTQFEGAYGDHHVGLRFADDGYHSTESAHANSSIYYDDPDNAFVENRVNRAKLYLPKGARVFGGNADENEVVLARGAHFNIISGGKSAHPQFKADYEIGIEGFDEDVLKFDDKLGIKAHEIKGYEYDPMYRSPYIDDDYIDYLYDHQYDLWKDTPDV